MLFGLAELQPGKSLKGLRHSLIPTLFRFLSSGFSLSLSLLLCFGEGILSILILFSICSIFSCFVSSLLLCSFLSSSFSLTFSFLSLRHVCLFLSNSRSFLGLQSFSFQLLQDLVCTLGILNFQFSFFGLESLGLFEFPELGLGQVAEFSSQLGILLVLHPVLELLLTVEALFLRELGPVFTELLCVGRVAHLSLQLVQSVSLEEALICSLFSLRNQGFAGGKFSIVGALPLKNDLCPGVGSQLLVVEDLELLPPLVAGALDLLARNLLCGAIHWLDCLWVCGDRDRSSWCVLLHLRVHFSGLLLRCFSFGRLLGSLRGNRVDLDDWSGHCSHSGYWHGRISRLGGWDGGWGRLGCRSFFDLGVRGIRGSLRCCRSCISLCLCISLSLLLLHSFVLGLCCGSSRVLSSLVSFLLSLSSLLFRGQNRFWRLGGLCWRGWDRIFCRGCVSGWLRGLGRSGRGCLLRVSWCGRSGRSSRGCCVSRSGRCGRSRCRSCWLSLIAVDLGKDLLRRLPLTFLSQVHAWNHH